MKKIISIAIAIFLSSQLIFAQDTEKMLAFKILEERGEVYFKIIGDYETIDFEKLNKAVSIDKVNDNQIFAYANRKQFLSFLDLNEPFEVLKAPSIHRRRVVLVKFVPG